MARFFGACCFNYSIITTEALRADEDGVMSEVIKKTFKRFFYKSLNILAAASIFNRMNFKRL